MPIMSSNEAQQIANKFRLHKQFATIIFGQRDLTRVIQLALWQVLTSWFPAKAYELQSRHRATAYKMAEMAERLYAHIGQYRGLITFGGLNVAICPVIFRRLPNTIPAESEWPAIETALKAAVDRHVIRKAAKALATKITRFKGKDASYEKEFRLQLSRTHRLLVTTNVTKSSGREIAELVRQANQLVEAAALPLAKYGAWKLAADRQRREASSAALVTPTKVTRQRDGLLHRFSQPRSAATTVAASAP